MDNETIELADSLGPFKFYMMKQENYSGEHREWREECTLPKGSTLTRNITQAVLTALTAAGWQRVPEGCVVVPGYKVASWLRPEAAKGDV